jgi:VWFA-related protein
VAYLKISLALLSGLLAASTFVQAQQQSKQPPSTATAQTEGQEPVKVFTEEVRLPIVAVDQFDHYDPTLEADDILVLEDGVPQQIRSVRHVPANVLVVLDTGGEFSGLGGMSKRTNLTREVAQTLVGSMQEGVWVALLQFNNTVDLLQPWTTDHEAASKVLDTKVSSGKRSRFSEAVAAAAQQIRNRPEGSRHIVFITDAVDSPGAKVDRAEALRQLIAARATVHIVSYTEFVRQKGDAGKARFEAKQGSTASDPIISTDPTLPPGTTRSPSFGVSIRFDPAMRRQRKAYEAATRKSQQALASLADETGGRIFLPRSGDQMIAQAQEIAREIGAEYVITYRPKRLLSSSRPGEYRRIEVASRRVGLRLRTRRGYVVTPGR